MVWSGISSDSGSVAELVIGLRSKAGDCTHQYNSQTPMKDSSSVLITSLVPDFDLQHGGDAAPKRAGDNRGQHRQDERQSKRQLGDMAIEGDGGCGDAADGDLSFAADIGQVGAVGEHKAEPDQREGDAAVDRGGDRIGRADRAIDKGRDRVRAPIRRSLMIRASPISAANPTASTGTSSAGRTVKR